RLPFFHRGIGYHGSNISYQIMELVTIIFRSLSKRKQLKYVSPYMGSNSYCHPNPVLLSSFQKNCHH
ncbi:MAG: hypothetical protein WAM22_02365, partial [Nitrososphaeraceae archaeon]